MTFDRARLVVTDDVCPPGPTDWYYRHLVPKGMKDNLLYRQFVLEQCYASDAIARDVWIICSRDILFYINTFGWTINPKSHARQPLRPFITYPYQDRAILDLEACLGVRDIAFPKSRDMGASWLCLITMEHRWHFTPNQLFLLTSEKEELVDGKSEKALFRKLDFWWNHLPDFMQPKMDRTEKHCRNMDNGSSFDGEATVANLATGDRRTAIMLDEMAKMPNAAKIVTSTRDVTDCRIFNSTPNGRFAIGQPFFQQVRNAHLKKVFMHWSEHPEKAKGLYLSVRGERQPVPPGYSWRDDYDFHTCGFTGARRPRSPWYDLQCERATSATEIPQECDIDFLGSSERYVDLALMQEVRARDCKDPVLTGRISVDPETLELIWIPAPRGPVKLWVELDQENLRPPFGQYSMGVDISCGTDGDYSSESAIVIWNRLTGEQVMEYGDSTIRPEDWARVCVAVARWFHNAFMVPEVNGPGNQFLIILRETGYPDVYRREVRHIGHKQITKKLGYQNQDGGAAIIGLLHMALHQRKAVLRSEKVVSQLLEYERKAGKLVHAASLTTESDSGRGELHGDVAIAASAGWMGVRERPGSKPEEAPREPEPGTVGYRLKQMELVAEARLDEEFIFG